MDLSDFQILQNHESHREKVGAASSYFWVSDFKIAPTTSYYIIGKGNGTEVYKTFWITVSCIFTLRSMHDIDHQHPRILELIK